MKRATLILAALAAMSACSSPTAPEPKELPVVAMLICEFTSTTELVCVQVKP